MSLNLPPPKVLCSVFLELGYANQLIKLWENNPLFADDGGGMDPECMRKCMSLGYSSKTSNTTIGQCN